MARLWSDSFDFYASTGSSGDIVTRYDSVTGSNLTLVSGANTAFGIGQALYSTNAASITKTFTTGTNETTIYFSLRVKIGNAAASIAFQLLDGSNFQCSAMINGDLSVSARTGSSSGTVLGSTAGVLTLNTWDSYQGKIVIGNTTGSVEIRKNGSSTPILSLTNVNTRGGSTNNYANRLQVLFISISEGIDDLIVWSDNGAAPTSWIGDPRSISLTPNGQGASTQFSLSPTNYNPVFTTVTTSNFSASANVIRFFPVTATATGTLAGLTMNFQTALTGHAKMALYDSTGASNGPGTLLATSAEITNPSFAINTFSVSAGPTVISGTKYWVAIMQDAAAVFLGIATTGGDSLSQTYSGGFPSSAAGFTVINGNGVNAGMNITPTNAFLVSDAQEDGDTTYVYSSTVGNEDLYTVSALPLSPASIIGVNTVGYARKSDSGARTASFQIKANGTETSSNSNVNLSLSYTWSEGWMPLDPTGAAWTATNINAAQIGIKVTG